jgi:hypothetical protein
MTNQSIDRIIKNKYDLEERFPGLKTKLENDGVKLFYEVKEPNSYTDTYVSHFIPRDIETGEVFFEAFPISITDNKANNFNKENGLNDFMKDCNEKYEKETQNTRSLAFANFACQKDEISREFVLKLIQYKLKDLTTYIQDLTTYIQPFEVKLDPMAKSSLFKNIDSSMNNQFNTLIQSYKDDIINGSEIPSCEISKVYVNKFKSVIENILNDNFLNKFNQPEVEAGLHFSPNFSFQDLHEQLIESQDVVLCGDKDLPQIFVSFKKYLEFICRIHTEPTAPVKTPEEYFDRMLTPVGDRNLEDAKAYVDSYNAGVEKSNDQLNKLKQMYNEATTDSQYKDICQTNIWSQCLKEWRLTNSNHPLAESNDKSRSNDIKSNKEHSNYQIKITPPLKQYTKNKNPWNNSTQISNSHDSRVSLLALKAQCSDRIRLGWSGSSQCNSKINTNNKKNIVKTKSTFCK